MRAAHLLSKRAKQRLRGRFLAEARYAHSQWREGRTLSDRQFNADRAYSLAPVPRSGITATGREADPGRPKEPPK